MKAISLFILALALALPIAADAQSLKQKQIQRDQQDYLNKEAEYTNVTCGTQIAAGFDWATYSDADYESNYSIYGYCEAALDALTSLCSDDLGKQAVAEKIKKLTCKRGTPQAVELVGDELVFTIDWEAANGTDMIKAYLEKTL